MSRQSSWLQDSRAHLKLAWPLCLGQVGQQLMALVDSAIIGHFDHVALAGLGVANTLLFTLAFFGVGVVLGLDSLVPQALGRGDAGEARSLYRSALRLAVQVGVPLTMLGAGLPLVLAACGVQADVAREADIYLYGRLPALLPYLIFSASASYLQALGHTRPIVVAVVVGNIINLIADLVLVFGDDALSAVGLPGLGLPRLGVLGASLSTCLVVLFMTSFLALAVSRHRVPGSAPASAALTAKIRRIGLPVGLQLLAEVGIFAIVGILAGRMGAIPGAAHQLALTIASVTFSVAVGMGAATSVRVGLAIGAGDTPRARRAGMVGLSLGAAFMGFAGIFFLVVPEHLARAFTDDSEIILATVPLLAIAALFQLSDATQAVIAGALRGAGDTRATFLGNLAGHYGVGLWIALALGLWLDMGVAGLWWGLSAGLTCTAVGLSLRFWWLTSRPIAPL